MNPNENEENNVPSHNSQNNGVDYQNASIASKNWSKTPPVWTYFDLKQENNKFFVQCTVHGCKDKLTYHNSTSAMISHLKFNHPEVYEV